MCVCLCVSVSECVCLCGCVCVAIPGIFSATEVFEASGIIVTVKILKDFSQSVLYTASEN